MQMEHKSHALNLTLNFTALEFDQLSPPPKKTFNVQDLPNSSRFSIFFSDIKDISHCCQEQILLNKQYHYVLQLLDLLTKPVLCRSNRRTRCKKAILIHIFGIYYVHTTRLHFSSSVSSPSSSLQFHINFQFVSLGVSLGIFL